MKVHHYIRFAKVCFLILTVSLLVDPPFSALGLSKLGVLREVSGPLTHLIGPTGATQTLLTSDRSVLQVSTLATGRLTKKSSMIIQVKFREVPETLPPEELLPSDLRNLVSSITRLFSLPKQELDRIEPNLNLWFQIILKPGTDVEKFFEDLKQLDNVEIVEWAPLPAPPP